MWWDKAAIEQNDDSARALAAVDVVARVMSDTDVMARMMITDWYCARIREVEEGHTAGIERDSDEIQAMANSVMRDYHRSMVVQAILAHQFVRATSLARTHLDRDPATAIPHVTANAPCALPSSCQPNGNSEATELSSEAAVFLSAEKELDEILDWSEELGPNDGIPEQKRPTSADLLRVPDTTPSRYSDLDVPTTIGLVAAAPVQAAEESHRRRVAEQRAEDERLSRMAEGPRRAHADYARRYEGEGHSLRQEDERQYQEQPRVAPTGLGVSRAVSTDP
ncbi:hypothetical protein QAD02_013790 [Eretmocerus hayati]|uniref:Uncharacterized protein n=1 Tax=Eretmocerus hayati TaxID=131215 RepID=A0ACC2P4H1_9HYME|nr:hypothetical protein QAD02_013790 [Eretmocerus hayati]